MGAFETRGRRLMSLSILIDANDDALTSSYRQLNLKGNGANAECVLATACIMSLLVEPKGMNAFPLACQMSEW